MHLSQNYLQNQIKRKKTRKEKHFFQNLQGFKRRKLKPPPKKNNKAPPKKTIKPKETQGWGI